jgi:3-isopropylmalate/(R)-2-methylmalate dehydratase large subunit
MSTETPRTMYDKIWDSHIVYEEPGRPTLIYIDKHIVHDVSAQAFAGLKAAHVKVRRPDLTVAVMDHLVPTKNRQLPILNTDAVGQMEALEQNCKEWGIRLFNLRSPYQGIVHIIGPELGITQPGQTLACGDSHTSTHGALGALPFGFGSSDIEHVLGTQCVARTKSKAMLVHVTGRRQRGVTAKDITLAIIGKIGISGGIGHVIEYGGEAIRALSIEGRMTVCNMSIEGGAVTGMVAPDETTFAYLEGRPFVPRGKEFQEAVEKWKQVPSDPGASYDRTVELDASTLVPQVTWGTNPGMVADVTGRVPDPSSFSDPIDREAAGRAIEYMGLRPGMPIQDIPVDRVFIGSCANSRIEDLRIAAKVIAGKKISPRVKEAIVVPGSMLVKAQGEKENLDKIFLAAGFEWRDAGCSLCVGMNGDLIPSGDHCASTSNRNFEGRQGKGSRTHLVSPMMAAAAAIAGHFVNTQDLNLPDVE